MKKVNEMKFVGTYAVDDDYRVDVFENDERFEAWLYNKNYGVKSSMFGWFKVQAAGEKVYTLEDFLELVEANADGYIMDYREDYEDEAVDDDDVNYWYAIQEETTDAWDDGSYDLSEAIEMANDKGYDIIAVIDESNGGLCVEELHRGIDF